MTVQIKGTTEAVTIRWIPKYTLVERTMHWLHMVTFVPLTLTGMILYFPFLQPMAQGGAGELVRLVHRVAAVLFGLLPILYLIIQPRRLLMSLREFLFDRYDLGWVKGAFGYYLLGKHAAMPPQGRFNTGEKMNGVIMVLSWIAFGITGLVMWFGKGIVPPALFRWMVIFHDLAMIVSVCMFLVHLYLAVGHPLMWAGLVSMRFGVTSADYAAEHHARWYYGPKRAQRLYEEARRRPEPVEGKKAASEAEH
jgi:formate dehydrogenase subunit gamma